MTHADIFIMQTYTKPVVNMEINYKKKLMFSIQQYQVISFSFIFLELLY